MSGLIRTIRVSLFISSFLIGGYAMANELAVKIHSLRNGEGFLAVSLFHENEAKSFPDQAEKAVQTFYLPLEGRTEVDLKIENLAAGNYALSLMHDEDGDRKFKTNFLGMPKEGYGFSLDAPVLFGPPSFKKASFEIPKTQEMKVKVRYF